MREQQLRIISGDGDLQSLGRSSTCVLTRYVLDAGEMASSGLLRALLYAIP